MNSKSNHWNRSAILWGVLAMLTILLLGALGTAALLHDGRIPESAIAIASVVIRSAATVAAAIVAWSFSERNPIRNVLVVVGISMTVMLILAMLFWRIDLHATLIGIGIAFGVAVLCGYALTRSGRGRSNKFKKASMVKMYKNFGR